MIKFSMAVPFCFNVFVQIYLYGTVIMPTEVKKAEQIQAIVPCDSS